MVVNSILSQSLKMIHMGFPSSPVLIEFRWAAETVVLRQTVNLFPKGNIGGSNPSPPTKRFASSVMVAQEIRDTVRWSRYQNAKSGSIP